MNALALPPYRFIHATELDRHLSDTVPVFRVRLYDENLDQGPKETVYIKFLNQYTYRWVIYEKEIRAILRNQFKSILAFRYEKLSTYVKKKKVVLRYSY